MLEETQGNRIWIFHTQIAGRKVDSGGIGCLLDAEIRFLRAMYEQINPARSRTQTGSGFFCNSDVKKIPNAIPLPFPPPSFDAIEAGWCSPLQPGNLQ